MKNSFFSRATLWLAVLVAVPVLALTSGCVVVAAGAGAGAVAYVRGDLTATLDASVEQTIKATNGAIQQLQFAKVSESKDALLGIIVVRNAADKKIKITIEHTTDKLTRVQIRVGLFGDEALSLTIFEKIKAGL